MWILKPKQSLWHYYDPAGARVGLCGATLPTTEYSRERETKPGGFDGFLCNRCWFQYELDQTLGALSNESTSNWLLGLDFGELSNVDSERLHTELGEERADTLRVVYNLAESGEIEIEEAPVAVPIAESAIRTEAELVVIPLLMREATIPPEPEPDEESEPEAAAPPEARMKVNCTRFAKEKNASTLLNRLFRRPRTERA